MISQIIIIIIFYPIRSIIFYINHCTLTAIYQCASVLMSLVSLSWSIVSYQQASRWATPEKPQMSPAGCLFQLFWKFFMIASRVMIMSLFATVYNVELFVFIGLHWMMMLIWILFMVIDKRSISKFISKFIIQR